MAASSNTIVAFVALLCFVVVTAGVRASPAPAAAPSSGSFFQETCEGAGVDAVLCVGPLSSDTAARSPAETSRFARALVLQAKQNDSETAAHLPRPYDSENLEDKSVELQRCFQGCKKRYEAAAALEKGKFDDANLLLGTVQAQVKLCQRACQAVPPQWELIERNRKVQSLCNVATAVTRMLQRH
ncbi:hypothetical protein ACQ4PT_030579 [Festuca glaucescens]